MRAIKTIAATAVIVFTLTTVAAAGVQHVTKPNGAAGSTQAQAAQTTTRVTHAAQSTQLVRSGQAAPANGTRHARQAHHQATATHHHARSHSGTSDTPVASWNSGGTRHADAAHHGTPDSHAGSHHTGASQHPGDCGGGGGDCRD